MRAIDMVELIGGAVEVTGVAVIALGFILATLAFLRAGARGWAAAYRIYRRQLGQAILLGLEFLVAGDIIRTVAIEPSLESVAVLAGIVLIRTFLSMSIEVEVQGRWPWQQAAGDQQEAAPID
jgi:uncharacterized membrane protein